MRMLGSAPVAAIWQWLALQAAPEDRGDALVRGGTEDERTGASGFQARGAVLLAPADQPAR